MAKWNERLADWLTGGDYSWRIVQSQTSFADAAKRDADSYRQEQARIAKYNAMYDALKKIADLETARSGAQAKEMARIAKEILQRPGNDTPF